MWPGCCLQTSPCGEARFRAGPSAGSDPVQKPWAGCESTSKPLGPTPAGKPGSLLGSPVYMSQLTHCLEASLTEMQTRFILHGLIQGTPCGNETLGVLFFQV